MTSVYLDRIEYSDEFSEEVLTSRELSMADVLQASTRLRFPAWIGGLFLVRDFVVKWFGLKTAKDLGRSQNKLGLFTVLAKTDNEIIAGEDDRHLNFRVVLSLAKTDDKIHCISFRTLVQFNNLLGKIYFIPVKPIHKIIVPLLLRSLTKEISRTLIAAEIS
jgi:hypothetical protein